MQVEVLASPLPAKEGRCLSKLEKKFCTYPTGQARQGPSFQRCLVPWAVPLLGASSLIRAEGEEKKRKRGGGVAPSSSSSRRMCPEQGQSGWR